LSPYRGKDKKNKEAGMPKLEMPVDKHLSPIIHKDNLVFIAVAAQAAVLFLG
jgi:hypothetical protein